MYNKLDHFCILIRIKKKKSSLKYNLLKIYKLLVLYNTFMIYNLFSIKKQIYKYIACLDCLIQKFGHPNKFFSTWLLLLSALYFE